MTISKEKSLISNRGCYEFAKQFLIKKGRVNISPVSVPTVRRKRNGTLIVLKSHFQFKKFGRHDSSHFIPI